VSVVCCQVCDGPITRPEESYRMWYVSECDREATIMRRPWPTSGCRVIGRRRKRRRNINKLLHFPLRDGLEILSPTASHAPPPPPQLKCCENALFLSGVRTLCLPQLQHGQVWDRTRLARGR
jgi:hypothetical protein